MFKHPFFWFLFGILVVIALMHQIGMAYHWYLYFWWFDVVLHFLGGIWIGGMTLWFYFLTGTKKNVTTNVHVFVIAGITVLIIGVAWEIFQIVIFTGVIDEDGYMFDTISDLILDTLGGLTAAGYFVWKKYNASM